MGDVITYRPPAGSGPAGLVTHRIVAITTDEAGRRTFRTKGDANDVADPWTFIAPERPSRRACAWACPTSASSLAALAERDAADAASSGFRRA